MTNISRFDSQVYSEETHPVTESEYDEVMQMMADEASGFEGYEEWSREIESDPVVNESENFRVRQSGRIEYKGANLKSNRIGGIEV
jgi:hypothetical protein